jgi:hypothetical protein
LLISHIFDDDQGRHTLIEHGVPVRQRQRDTSTARKPPSEGRVNFMPPPAPPSAESHTNRRKPWAALAWPKEGNKARIGHALMPDISPDIRHEQIPLACRAGNTCLPDRSPAIAARQRGMGRASGRKSGKPCAVPSVPNRTNVPRGRSYGGVQNPPVAIPAIDVFNRIAFAAFLTGIAVPGRPLDGAANRHPAEPRTCSRHGNDPTVPGFTGRAAQVRQCGLRQAKKVSKDEEANLDEIRSGNPQAG